jgi:site-specific recombinase XerD
MFLAKNDKSPYYQIVFFENGKRTTRSTKQTSEQEALKFLKTFKRTYQNPSDVDSTISQITIVKNTITLSEFKDEYLDYCFPVKSKKYLDSIAYSFKQFISFCGNPLLNEIEIKTIDKFIYSTFHRTQRGAHHYYRTLKAAFNKAVEWNYISINPFTKVKFPKIPKSFPVFLLEDELLIILANTSYQHLKDIFTVGFYTGLRLGELINMRWDWINFFQNHITVKCSDQFLTKNKKERIVPMNEKVRSILLSRFNSDSHLPSEIVFCRIRNKILYQESISKQFKKIVRKSNLSDKIHFHTLRHSFASLLAQKGVSLYIIKELLGHEDLATTQIYSHLQQQNLKDAVNLL